MSTAFLAPNGGSLLIRNTQFYGISAAFVFQKYRKVILHSLSAEVPKVAFNLKVLSIAQGGEVTSVEEVLNEYSKVIFSVERVKVKLMSYSNDE